MSKAEKNNEASQADIAGTASVTAEKSSAKRGKREAGFRPDGQAFPGVDPETGERKAVTYEGLKAEFGQRVGARLYNDIAVVAFGGVLPQHPDLSIATLADEFALPGDEGETDEAYQMRMQRRAARRERVAQLFQAAAAEGDN